MDLQKNKLNATKTQLELARELQVDPLIILLLNQRNFVTRSEIIAFLNPSLAELPNPKELQGIAEATSLILEVLDIHEDIIIWGDYDVDGISSSALLFQFFKSVGKDVKCHIPDRLSEGYGLNEKTLIDLRNGCSGNSPLLITVDCGISNFKEIRKAKSLGFHVIVTDHHELPDQKVGADVVVNPKMMDNDSPFYNLAGVGVAFYLAAGLRAELQKNNYFVQRSLSVPNMKQYLAYVALGSIADMVPLTGMNRTLVRAGFEAITESNFQGIKALLSSCDIYGKILTSDDIGFSIAPKINAAGRIGKAKIAFDLLISNEEQTAAGLAEKLTVMNLKRKNLTKNVFEQTVDHSQGLINQGDSCIILKGDYHQGIIGIVASQLVEKFRVPVILFSRIVDSSGNRILKGSGRSVEGVNLFSILSGCDNYIIQFGGHEMAAGLTITEDNFDGFKLVINKLVASEAKKDGFSIKTPVDLTIPVDQLFSNGILEQLQLLEPFGEGNRQPIFHDKHSTPVHMSLVGNGGGHIKFRFRGKFDNREGIGFGLGSQFSELREKRSHSIIYSPMLNRFKRSVSWQVKILSIQ